MRNKNNKQEFVFDIDTDVRKWFTGLNTINVKLVTSSDMPAGTYELLLFLPDAYESIAKRPEYALRFANENMWEETTGYNNLQQVITIQ